MKNRWIIRDLLILMLMFFMLCTVILIKHSVSQKQTGAIDSPGRLAVAITWPEGDNDVDVWLMGPGEPHPVGYSAPNGLLWNLLRDDLGNIADLMPGNYENAYTRGVPDGLYVVNLHCFRCSAFPIPVTVELRQKLKTGSSTVQIVVSKVTLDHDKQEKTAFQFIVKDGEVDRSTITQVFRPLIGGEK